MVRYANSTAGASVVNEQVVLGNAFAAGELFGGVANTDTKQVVIENPTTEKAFFIYSPEVDSSGQVFTTIIKNVSVNTVGADAVVTGKRTDIDDPEANVFTAGDNETGVISGGVDYPTVTAGGGTNASNANPAASSTNALSAIIAPGDNIAVEARNESGSTQDISILIDYTEAQTDRL